MTIQLADLLFKNSRVAFPYWDFPLNVSLFEQLLLLPHYELHGTLKLENGEIIKMTDFDVLYHKVIGEMSRQGVQFFSPGGSHKRLFLYWFNAHFWQNVQFQYEIDIKEKYVELLYAMVLVNTNFEIPEGAPNETIIIAQGKNKLSSMGQAFLQAKAPSANFEFPD